MHIVSAPWIIPVNSAVIRNGTVAISEGRIKAVGGREDVLGRYPGTHEVRYSCALMPGLVNAHMHLELSCLGGSKELQKGELFTAWIESLIEEREKRKAAKEAIRKATEDRLKEQYESGVVLIADTGNIDIGLPSSFAGSKSSQLYRMIEVLGPNKMAIETAMSNLKSLPDDTAITAHAPYSTGPQLIKAVKERCRSKNHVFSIHTSESEHEHQFLSSFSGPFKEFLRRRNSLDDTFKSLGNVNTSVEYYQKLGILDNRTMLVHCVHVTYDDLSLISDYNAHICVCPGSNKFLKVGVAPVSSMLNAGILPAIGTDSIASNYALDLWREMQLLHSDHPGIDPETIIKMATSGGAEALGRNTEYGSLEVGKKASFLHVSSEKLLACRDEKELYRVLVTAGKPDMISHVTSECG